MRYELAQTVSSDNPGHVVEFLENQLKRVSSSCLRSGLEVTASGIEATFGSIQRKSVVVCKVRSASGRTLITADVLYKPSLWFWCSELFLIFTLIGWAIPLILYLSQRGTVKNAIATVLDRVKAEAEFGSHFASPTTSAPSFTPPPVAGPSSPPPASQPGERQASEPLTLPRRTEPFDQARDIVTSSEPVEDSWRVASIVLGCTTILLGLGFAYMLGSMHRDSTDAKRISEATASPDVVAQPAAPISPSSTPSAATPTLRDAEAQTSPATDDGKAISDQHGASSNDDVRSLLQGWVDASTSEDPSGTAMFYAPTSVHYFLQPSVDRAFIINDRRKQYEMKGRPVSFKLNNVEITYDPDGTAVVSFQKQISFSTSEGTVGETGDSSDLSATRSVLKIRNIEGDWKIISERDYTN